MKRLYRAKVVNDETCGYCEVAPQAGQAPTMSVYRMGAPAPKVAPPTPWWRLLRAWLQGIFHKLENRRGGFGWVFTDRDGTRRYHPHVGQGKHESAYLRVGADRVVVPPIGPGKPTQR